MTQTPPAGEGARPETLERSVRSRMAPRVAPRVAPRIVPRLVQAPGDLASGRGGVALLERAIVLFAGEDSGADQ
jgi:hypothetical protein